jgi:nitrite reductase/ring-hydroxylating ferredoxin subunit
MKEYIIESEDIREINGKMLIKVCESKRLPEKRGIKVHFPEDEDLQIAVFRVKGEIYVVDNICPHRHQDRLYEGIIKDETITCPLHGWTYSLVNGNNLNKRQGVKMLECYYGTDYEGWIWVEKPKLKIPKWRDNTELMKNV